jgi:hypothetical protein
MQQESTTHLDTAVELSSSSGQQSMKCFLVGQYAEPAHGTSDIGDDLASCPEVERAASIGSAYVGSNPRPPR